ncbi:MAG TPA: thiamine phosphate synthase, partial [Rhodospirillales bacterium]|nr:thiamine phosphate synthase [Rhodospirillales bacterium]
MTDRRRLPDPLAALQRLPPGSAVIARETDAVRRAALVRLLRPLCRRRGLRLLVAADEGLSRTVDGLHLPEATVRHGPRRWRRFRRPAALVTAAAHAPAAIWRAAAQGVHAILLSPVFATASHPGAVPLGPIRLARMVRASPLPVYALGGIDTASA